MSEPLVSIITPVLNAKAYLEEAIQSVQGQTYRQWELIIIVDKNSSDNSLQIAQDFSRKDSRIKVIQNLDLSGVCANRNYGIQMSVGHYIAFLDADDRWRPSKVQHQVEFMEKHGASISAHSYSRISQEGTPLRGLREVPLKLDRRSILADNKVGCLTVMIKKSDFDKIEFTDGDHEDLRLWLDLLTKKTTIWGLNENLAEYRVVEGSRSGNKLWAATARMKIIFKDPYIGLPRKFYCFATYAIHGVLKSL